MTLGLAEAMDTEGLNRKLTRVKGSRGRDDFAQAEGTVTLGKQPGVGLAG